MKANGGIPRRRREIYMNLNRLQEFVMIKESGSITKAADILALSPAALGARLRTFEQSLGFSLFERSRSTLVLTPEGERFYKDAKKIETEYQKLKKELLSIEKAPFSSLRIAIVGSGLPFYLGPFLDLVNARYPRIQLDLIDDTHCSIEDGLLSGQVDLYFAPVMDSFHAAGITRLLISHTRQHVLLPANHRLASKQDVSLRELENERFILYPSTCETCVRDFQLANLKASGIHYSLYEHNSSTTFYELLVPIQKGIIISPDAFLNVPPNSVALPLTDAAYEAPSALLYCRNSGKPETDRFVTEFLRFIKGETSHEHRKAL